MAHTGLITIAKLIYDIQKFAVVIELAVGMTRVIREIIVMNGRRARVREGNVLAE